MILSIVLAVVGVLLLVLAGWLRLGRSEGARSWVGQEQFERTVLVTVPMVGVACLALAVMTATGTGPAQSVATFVLCLAVVVFLLFNPVGLRMPAWTLPKWYVARTAARDRARRDRRNRRRQARAHGGPGSRS